MCCLVFWRIATMDARKNYIVILQYVSIFLNFLLFNRKIIKKYVIFVFNFLGGCFELH